MKTTENKTLTAADVYAKELSDVFIEIQEINRIILIDSTLCQYNADVTWKMAQDMIYARIQMTDIKNRLLRSHKPSNSEYRKAGIHAAS